ncbi:flagellar transcriptional regulator FlhD [Aromatoleum evansii]|jgi:hypothetical protein|uniref:flagellar transcriptional regulator FlhD n=1 Tax=Aromatoleum evansii TaxID=59406 RepID=UPI00145F3D4A|nr:flagellar transcriptional regulator FlhD [Aromatoleum evansii]NMG28377.1 hypothetical protein [Aromatoleum evansii]
MTVTTKNIHDLNHQYLLAMKEHALRDIADASQRFGVTVEFAQTVTDMTQQELKTAAQTGNLIFRSCLTPNDLGNLIRADDTLRNVLGVLAASRAVEAA